MKILSFIFILSMMSQSVFAHGYGRKIKVHEPKYSAKEDVKKIKNPDIKYNTSASTMVEDAVSSKESAIERDRHHPRRRIRQIESNSGTKSPDGVRSPQDARR